MIVLGKKIFRGEFFNPINQFFGLNKEQLDIPYRMTYNEFKFKFVELFLTENVGYSGF